MGVQQKEVPMRFNRTKTLAAFLVAANLISAGFLVQGAVADEGDGRCDTHDCYCTGNVCQINGTTFKKCEAHSECE